MPDELIKYNSELEQLLKENSEECESLSILHRMSYEKYNQRSNYINIPVIILSSAIGFITGIDLQYAQMNIILGVGSVFVGIIKSVDTYFQLAKRAESHRICSLQFSQIYKKIQIELTLNRKQRLTPENMMNIIKTDIKNMQDIAPLIDDDIIDQYNQKYRRYKRVKKPNFVNGLTEVKVNSAEDDYDYASRQGSREQSPSGGGPDRDRDRDRDHDRDHDRDQDRDQDHDIINNHIANDISMLELTANVNGGNTNTALKLPVNSNDNDAESVEPQNNIQPHASRSSSQQQLQQLQQLQQRFSVSNANSPANSIRSNASIQGSGQIRVDASGNPTLSA
jgi:hypothetical protein